MVKKKGNAAFHVLHILNIQKYLMEFETNKQFDKGKP